METSVAQQRTVQRNSPSLRSNARPPGRPNAAPRPLAPLRQDLLERGSWRRQAAAECEADKKGPWVRGEIPDVAALAKFSGLPCGTRGLRAISTPPISLTTPFGKLELAVTIGP